VPVLLLLVATGLRAWNLGSPARAYWDEQPYIYDANAYLGGGFGLEVGTPPSVKIADEGTWIHPPLGKWIMALLGVGPFGLDPFGWRVPSLVFGVAGVLLLYLLALELWGSVWWAGFAGGLLALDGLHIVQSRVAMLDIFLTTFLTAGFLFLVRHRARARDRSLGRVSTWFASRELLLAGVMFGAAVATKWAGLLGLGLAIVLAVTWSFTDHDRRGHVSPVAQLRGGLLSLVLVPVAIYLISYGAFFAEHGPAFGAFWRLQTRMLEYHQHHVQVQPENSAPWTWPILLHPIRYYGESSGPAVLRIMALGNPALWWGFLILIPVAAVNLLRRAVWQDAVVLGGFGAMYVPWFFVGRTQFIFYMLPAVPFMCLALAGTIRTLPVRAARVLTFGVGIAVVVAAVAYTPLWIGTWVDASWAARLRLLPGWNI
jgi:dolichyl-phosphate-mannose-protein mannosyltransferase